MNHLMRKAGIRWPPDADIDPTMPELQVVGDCVLLKNEFDRNKHIKRVAFPDLTGYECFINHMHFPFGGTAQSLSSCLVHANSIRAALGPLTQNRSFRLIVGISEEGRSCTIRFHVARPGEAWVSDDLEAYAPDAILVEDVLG